MKKLLSVCLVLVMVICFSVTAMAEGGFISSPSLNPAPEVIEPTDGSIVVHSYSKRNELSEDKRNALEDAYNSIKSTNNLSDLNGALNGKNIGVSDLFNVGYNGTNAAGNHSVTLKADTLNNFVALMTYVNGEWKIVEGAKIQNGNLVFTAKDFGPYAIVVNTDGTKSPQTGINETANTQNSAIAVYGILMAVSACGALIMWRKAKKHTA